MALSAQELQQQGGGQTWYLPLTPSYNVFSQRFQVRFFHVVLGRERGKEEGGSTNASSRAKPTHAHLGFIFFQNQQTTPDTHDSSPPSVCP